MIARERGLGFMPCEVHHLTCGSRHGAKRLGHEYTVGLNRWSHRGVPLTEYGWDAATCREKLGPSYAREPAAFRAQYPDSYLLQLQDAQLMEDAA